MLKTYTGSCHCGAVRFEAQIDLSAGTGKCNCTFCSKTRWWSAIIKPEAFRLLTPRDALSDYHKEGGPGHFFFCKTCGVRSFGDGYLEEIGGAYVSVYLRCLDNATPEELIAAPVRYFDGLNNTWFEEPKEVRHL
ncbi:MAG TPA: GFA family protein [bacterium]